MARAVLFDLDGVLVDTYEAWFALVRATARHFGAPEVTRPAFDATWGQSVEDDTRELVPGPTVADVAAHYAAHFAEHAALVVVDPEAGGTLADLRGRRIPTACVTNSPAPIARDVLAAAGLGELLDALVAAGEEIRPKPAPDMVLAACARLDVPPGAAVLLGDSRFDAEAAAAAGVPYVAYDVRRRESLARAVHAAIAGGAE